MLQYFGMIAKIPKNGILYYSIYCIKMRKQDDFIHLFFAMI